MSKSEIQFLCWAGTEGHETWGNLQIKPRYVPNTFCHRIYFGIVCSWQFCLHLDHGLQKHFYILSGVIYLNAFIFFKQTQYVIMYKRNVDRSVLQKLSYAPPNISEIHLCGEPKSKTWPAVHQNNCIYHLSILISYALIYASHFIKVIQLWSSILPLSCFATIYIYFFLLVLKYSGE